MHRDALAVRMAPARRAGDHGRLASTALATLPATGARTALHALTSFVLAQQGHH